MKKVIHDICGIGIGPFNLSLAALLEKDGLNLCAVFLEAKSKFDWHPGLMLSGSKLQVPFLADLVTLTDPTNSYTFLNYLSEQNRLYKFYFLEDTFLYRKEYESYCKWAAAKLKSCQFDRKVTSVEFGKYDDQDVYVIKAHNAKNEEFYYYAKNIVIGVGSTPNLPACCQNLNSNQVFHTSQFLHKTDVVDSAKKVAVIGSGQSAAECVLSLLQQNIDQLDQLYWITRSDGFFPMEASALGLEHFSPDYMNYFYALNNDNKLKYDIIRQQYHIYKGISLSTLKDIYNTIYQLTINNDVTKFKFSTLREVVDIKINQKDIIINLNHIHRNAEEIIATDVAIFGTGYSYHFPHFLNPLQNSIAMDKHGYWVINQDFQLDLAKPSSFIGNIYIQNGEIYSHGIGAPDLGLGAYRSAKIINQIAASEIYKVPTKAVFQSWEMAS